MVCAAPGVLAVRAWLVCLDHDGSSSSAERHCSALSLSTGVDPSIEPYADTELTSNTQNKQKHRTCVGLLEVEFTTNTKTFCLNIHKA